MVIVMVLALMVRSPVITAVERRPVARSSEQEALGVSNTPTADAAASTAVGGDLDPSELAAIAIALHRTIGAGQDVHSAAYLAALGVALETILHGQSSVPVLVANQSGVGLATSRWVAAGRALQTH